jgi:hypothetical protein
MVCNGAMVVVWFAFERLTFVESGLMLAFVFWLQGFAW